MTKYFDQFPIIDYNLTGVNGNTTEVTDIFRRVKARSKIADNVTLFDKYDVAEGEKPEDVAYKVYGEADYFWIVTLVNNIVNRYYDWPLDSFSFQEYIKASILILMVYIIMKLHNLVVNKQVRVLLTIHTN